MQQMSSFPLLGPAPSNAGQVFNHAGTGAAGMNSMNPDSVESTESGLGFSMVFNSVTTTDETASVTTQPISWDQFLEQYPQLADQLGSDFNFSEFFSQFEMDGQGFTQIMGAEGEMLPLDLDYQGLGGALQDMTAWFKDVGIELTMDDSGQIVPMNMSALDEFGIDPDAAAEAIENIAQTIAQLFTTIQQQKEALAQAQSEGEHSAGQEQALLSSVNGKALGLQAQNAGVGSDGESNKGQVVSSFVQPLKGSFDTGAANQANTASSQGGVTNAVAQDAVGQGLQQGFSQQGQSESNQQFRQSMEAAMLGDGSDSVVDEMVGFKTAETVGVKFTELQARVQGDNLKQYSTSVNAPVGNPEWTDQMSQKIVWMAGRSIQAAEIHLNPAELGPVEVKINVQNDQAAISFNAQHASVRELLESNVHRLREMMNSNGVELADVNVGGGEQQEAGFAQEQGKASSGSGGLSDNEDGVIEGEEEVVKVEETSAGLVDYYA